MKRIFQSLESDEWYNKPLYVIIPIAVILFFRKLGSAPLYMWDESLYANIASLTVRNGYWIIPHWNTPNTLEPVPFLEKPPLTFWFQAISIRFFGNSEFAIRLPSAVAAIACTVVVYKLAELIYNRQTAIAAALVFLVITPISVGKHSGRTGDTDMLFILFGTTFLLFLLLVGKKDRALHAAAIFGALAVLAKGANAGIFLIIAVPLVVASPRKYLNRQTVPAFGIGLLILVPWFLLATLKYPNLFEVMILEQALSRASSGATVLSDPLFSFMNYPYFRRLPIYFWPFGPIVAIGTVFSAIGFIRSRRFQRGFLLWWFISVFVFFVFTGNHIHYVLPMVVPSCVFIGYLCSNIWQFLDSNLDVPLSFSTRQYLLAGLLLSVSIHMAIPVGDYGSQWDKKQYTLAQDVDIPEDTPIYLEDQSVRNNNIWVFEYYSAGDVMITSPQRIRSDKQIKYAIVSNESLSRINREYSVLAQDDLAQIKVIKLKS